MFKKNIKYVFSNTGLRSNVSVEHEVQLLLS